MLGSTVLVWVEWDWGNQELDTALGGSQGLEALLEKDIVDNTPQGAQQAWHHLHRFVRWLDRSRGMGVLHWLCTKASSGTDHGEHCAFLPYTTMRLRITNTGTNIFKLHPAAFSDSTNRNLFQQSKLLLNLYQASYYYYD